MEKPHFPGRKSSPNLSQKNIAILFRCFKNKFMVYDFCHLCNTYSKDFYTAGYFSRTVCPKCGSVGRFKLHGSYVRYIILFRDFKPSHEEIEVKRIMCKSCKTTHAVLPGDIIAYKLLSLFVFLSILISFHIKKIPVLKIAGESNFSFQFIYAMLNVYIIYINRIHQFFKETVPASAPLFPGALELLTLLKSYDPYTKFQYYYIKINNSPCFMCKFLNGGKPPPIGIISGHTPFKGRQHNL